MAELPEDVKKRIDELRSLRDDLRVRGALARMDLKSAWDDLEQRWPELEASLNRYQQRGGQALDELRDATVALIKDLSSGYDRLKKLL